MRPIDTVEISKALTFNVYKTLYPAPERGSRLPAQEVLLNPSVGFLPVPTRLNTAVELIKNDQPQQALQAMQVDYRVASISNSIESSLEAAAAAARAEEAERTW